MASTDIGDWYRSIPLLSKYWFTGSVVLPLAAKIGLVGGMTMILHYEMVVYYFQVHWFIYLTFTVSFESSTQLRIGITCPNRIKFVWNFVDLETSYGSILLSDHTENRIALLDELILFIFLLNETRDW